MTIYDIAKEAGVSASTVSRVLNGKPGIHAETRRRVQALLEKYNYAPNEAARGLVTQASRLIGILIEDIRTEHHTESVYAAEQELRKLGYTCITLSTGPDDVRRAECIRLLAQRRVEGAILIGSMFGTEAVKKSIEEHLSDVPVVIANGWLDLPNVYGVLVDEARGIEACTALLWDKGKRHPVYLYDAETPANGNKRRGFATALLMRGVPMEQVRSAAVFPEESGTAMAGPQKALAGGGEATERILQEYPETDALIFATDLLAVGALRALRRLGKRVPEDVAVIGVDNTLYSQICMPMLTTLDNRLGEVSKSASAVLLDALEGRTAVHRMMLFPEICERETT